MGTNRETPYGDDCARFWRELLMVERLQRLQHDGLAHEVNVNHYMGNTSSLQAFNHWLTSQPSTFSIEHTITWGAVFGVRYGRLWTFYLQENAYVIRYRIVRKKQVVHHKPKNLLDRLFGSQTETVIVEQRKDATTAVPLSVRPFFPEGGGDAAFWTTFRKSYAPS